ncbi:TIGR00341 family protein [Wenzhouxiangella marina]|uniref:TIGR00341 family protein n=1 Tax=Wenzhouxiangella marina TaxID=1579979 RepID=A0A0K0XW49_9GAMM|nr:TIGR00341 family protein [Wenzhouxiangella marina]AKS41852.1 TIGR00341 family protein [Wenzhouxiangella marina]MBB6086382.1 putative hydrophobic protein (TIGR00341 family) [Wenzhouxiangella marina]
MAVRLIEMRLPLERLEGLRQRILELEPIELSALVEQDGQRAVLRVLVEQGKVEAFLDRFEALSERYDDFRMTLYAVEATLPVPEAPAENAEQAEPAKSQDEVDRLSRIELHERVRKNARLNPEYLLLVLFSSIVAAVGLVQGNVAVLVGAMVIAPLLGPNMALAMAATLADAGLGWRAVRTGMAGVALATVLGLLCGAFFEVDPALPEIANRTRIGTLDLILALAAGGAGALAMTSGVAGTLVGVMVAVALLPPLLVAALLAGAGQWREAAGALLLYSTNVAAVNLSAIVVFLGRGISPRTWWDKARARRSAWWFLLFWAMALTGLALLFILQNRQLGG